MQALADNQPDIRFLIFTTVPHWFFAASVTASFEYISELTDIGLAQIDPLQEDLTETLVRLDHFYPVDRSRLIKLGQVLTARQCDLVVSDISPLGIAVATECGIPSLLIENFTWDWIYRAYSDANPGFNKHADYLAELFGRVDYHIVTEPYCVRKDPDLVTKPICRTASRSKEETRISLDVGMESKVVIISLGGIQGGYEKWDQLLRFPEIIFLIPGTDTELKREGNTIRFPHHSGFYHPDLIEASDLVISKIGYSTLAETYQSGKPFGYIPRTGFRESSKLEAFVQSQMAGIAISESEYRSGTWVFKLGELLELPSVKRQGPKGAQQAADFIIQKLS
jgi:hypothetical protein